MSRFPQRWRTQRNAIRHANCRIQWVIKILNASCTASAVCLLECLYLPTTPNWSLDGLPWYKCMEVSDEKCSPSTVASWLVRLHLCQKTSNLPWKTWTLILIGPPISQDYPLNLSILLSGGKETNQDSPSNGEWSGKSSDFKSSEL